MAIPVQPLNDNNVILTKGKQRQGLEKVLDWVWFKERSALPPEFIQGLTQWDPLGFGKVHSPQH